MMVAVVRAHAVNAVFGLGEDNMTEYSIIKDGKVINRIVASKSFAEKYAQKNGVEVSDSVNAVIGATKQNGKFIKPVSEAKIEKSALELLTEMLVQKGTITEADASKLKEVK